MHRLLPLILAASAAASPASAADLRVRLDPRLELAGALTLLGPGPDPRGFVRRGRAYDREVLRLFAADAKRPAVAAQAGLSREDFVELCDFIDKLTDDLRPNAAYPATRNPERAAWLAQLRGFRYESRFAARFPALEAAAEAELKPLREAIGLARAAKRVEAYTGLPFDGSYVVTASPFLENERMRNSVLFRDDGTYELRTILGLDDARPDREYFLKERIPITIWHQLAHGTLDILADIHRADVAGKRGLYKKLGWDCFSSWENCVKENIARAVYLRLAALDLGEAAAKRAYDDEPAKEWPYMDKLLAALNEYENDRKRWPTLAHFYPRLLAVFPDNAGKDGSPAGDPFTTPGRKRKAEALRALAAR
jgi:hypothetical protein